MGTKQTEFTEAVEKARPDLLPTLDKIAAKRMPGIDPKTGEYSTLQMMLDEMSGGDTSQPLFD